MAKNPPWTRDELILALDLYFDLPPNSCSSEHPQIIELSKVLNSLPIHDYKPDAERFRNPNGVYMKLCNFLRFDPGYSGTGLKAGGKLEQKIWDEYFNNRQELKQIAGSIRKVTKNLKVREELQNIQVDEDEECAEGKVLLKLHKTRERNTILARKKKLGSLKGKGKLECEICSFDFAKKYGNHGYGYIECHHIKPLSGLIPGAKTKIKDLALVCSNCHRMLHKGRILLNIDELKLIIEGKNKHGTET
jgi:5-methylcytosine-specific restriction protein A